MNQIGLGTDEPNTIQDMIAIERPKLIFLAHPFPPVNAIASVRTWNIAKHLASLGWDVTVVTPNPSVWRHVENVEETERLVAQTGISLILTHHNLRFLSPFHLRCGGFGLGLPGKVFRLISRHLGIDRDIGWCKPVKQACSALTAKDADVILATGPPYVAFALAQFLSERLSRPFVLDYRDPWADNPHWNYPEAQKHEAKVLDMASAVTTVSSSCASLLQQRYCLGEKLHVVTNGYDVEDLQLVEAYEFGHFAIVYAGSFHPPKRAISPVMAALKRIKESSFHSSRNWRFHYYGGQLEYVRQEAARFGVIDKVVMHGHVTRSEALSALKGSDISLVITVVNEDATVADKGMVTGKLFESLGMGKRVLLVAPADSDAATIAKSSGSVHRFSGNDIDGMATFLKNAMLNAICDVNNREGAIEAYAWPNIAKHFDSILRAAIAKSATFKPLRGAL